MKGIFFVQLQNYVYKKFDRSLWSQIMAQAGIKENQLYFSNQQYSEDDFFKILSETIRLTKSPRDQLLADIGESLSPFFFQTFQPLLNKEWRTLDLVERIEQFNYKILQEGDEAANIGKLICKRTKPNIVEFKYTSPRKLCWLVGGLIKGFAKHYNEKITVKQTQCIFEHDPECYFQVTLTEHPLLQKSPLINAK